MSHRRRWDDDDDDSPVYRGNRQYEGFGSSIGDMVNDAVVSVKNAAADLSDNLAREAKKNEMLDRLGQSMKDLGDDIKETTADLSERVGHEWQKATKSFNDDDRRSPPSSRSSGSRGGGGGARASSRGGDDEPGSRRMLGNMPPGCFCDMRGYKCPMHPGREAWRFARDYQLHLSTNVDPEKATTRAVNGIAGEALPETQDAQLPPSPAPT